VSLLLVRFPRLVRAQFRVGDDEELACWLRRRVCKQAESAGGGIAAVERGGEVVLRLVLVLGIPLRHSPGNSSVGSGICLLTTTTRGEKVSYSKGEAPPGMHGHPLRSHDVEKQSSHRHDHHCGPGGIHTLIQAKKKKKTDFVCN
jgi:hypothetical protein